MCSVESLGGGGDTRTQQGALPLSQSQHRHDKLEEAVWRVERSDSWRRSTRLAGCRGNTTAARLALCFLPPSNALLGENKGVEPTPVVTGGREQSAFATQSLNYIWDQDDKL